MATEEVAGLNQAGSNITSLKKDIKAGVDKIENLKADRTALNEEIASVRSDLQAKGIPKAALDMAMKYMNFDPEKREGFDMAYDIVREAIDLPIDANQGSLFPEDAGDKSGDK